MSYYVGIRKGEREAFKSETEPTKDSHGSKYAACIGPFRTKRGTEFLVKYGKGNPHLTDVDTIEKIAKAEA